MEEKLRAWAKRSRCFSLRVGEWWRRRCKPTSIHRWVEREGRLAESVHDRCVAALEARDGDGVMSADDAVGAFVTAGDEVAVGLVGHGLFVFAPNFRHKSKTVRGRRGGRTMWASLGGNCPVAALTELC